MSESITRTIAALRKRATATAAVLSLQEAVEILPAHVIALCDAAEAGLRCPPREPTARMFIAGTKALLDADGSFARAVWNAMHDEWVNEGGQDVSTRKDEGVSVFPPTTGNAPGTFQHPAPPSPGEHCYRCDDTGCPSCDATWAEHQRAVPGQTAREIDAALFNEGGQRAPLGTAAAQDATAPPSPDAHAPDALQTCACGEFYGRNNHAPDCPVRRLVERLTAELAEARAEVERLRAALLPFAADEFQAALGGQIQGDDSPAWGRNGAILTLGDFRRARAAICAAPAAVALFITAVAG